ncbi:MAG TPA: hypothetical protein VF581_11960 [Flavobacterium sp.]|jgi:hypothetical protein
METNNYHGIAEDKSDDNGGNGRKSADGHTETTKLEEVISNDGMTSASARKTGGGDEHTPSETNYDPSEKPGGKFNINDQAHSQSSKEDFIKTVSNYKHEDGTTPPSQIDSQNLSPD